MNNERGFAAIPNWLVLDPDINPHDKLVYMVLSSKIGTLGVWFISHAEIATLSGISVSSVQRALSRLRDIGVVSWEPRSDPKTRAKLGNQYRLLIDRLGQNDRPPYSQRPTPPITVTDQNKNPKEEPLKRTNTSMSDAAEASSDADDEPSTEIVLDSDARRLCEVLSGMMSINGNKTPKKIPDAWVKAADRLLRIDGYTYDQAYMVLDWCQRSEFWQSNILSMPKFREKFDTLKGQMFRDRRAASAYKTREDRNAEILAKYRKEG